MVIIFTDLRPEARVCRSGERGTSKTNAEIPKERKIQINKKESRRNPLRASLHVGESWKPAQEMILPRRKSLSKEINNGVLTREILLDYNGHLARFVASTSIPDIRSSQQRVKTNLKTSFC